MMQITPPTGKNCAHKNAKNREIFFRKFRVKNKITILTQ